MKFGKYLESKARPEWRTAYMDYKRLKDLIKTAAEEAAVAAGGIVPDFSPRTTSLTVARNGGPGQGRRNAEEAFYEALEAEVSKVNKFTVGQVSALKKRLKALVVRANAAAAGRPPPASVASSGRPPLPPSAGGGGGDVEAGLPTSAPSLSFSAGTSPSGAPEPVGPLLEEAKAVGDEFLALEKYVNLNYLGFHKILKKHDKNCPHAPCQQFYVAHLHHQPWVQGNYSGLLVQLSAVYAALRGDTAGTKNEDASQGFVRSTTKYWVRTADVSAVKHAILQHLPVFQYNAPASSSGGGGGGGGGAGPSSGEAAEIAEPSDAQLINSTYLDNSSMELYHGRLDKRPGAIAVRVRWYGDGPPRTCFVERKTHRESWKGEESVKERFALPEPRVFPFLTGEYSAADAAADLRAAGKREEEVSKFISLFEEVAAQVDAKQLAPVLRTQYQRTAFQIPYDSTVRISLDTNLVMIKENPDDGPSCLEAGRWFRDPALPVPRTEITRFPHAVLEVKLSLPEGHAAPGWVTDLLESGYLTEVHKFSKFMHGSATLLPDLVQAVPYWVDDESVRPSMLASAPVAVPGPGRSGREAGAPPVPAAGAATKPRRRAGWADEGELSHPLLGDAPTLQLLPGPGDGPGGRRATGPPSSTLGARLAAWVDSYFGSRAADAPPHTGPLPSLSGLDAPLLARTVPMRIEPKTFLANERTFLSWLHMAVTIGSIAAALLGFAGAEAAKAAKAGTAGRHAARFVEVIALLLLPVAVLMCAYALFVFVWRSRAIARKQVGYIDDRYGPLGLAAVVVAALSAILLVSLIDLLHTLSPPPGPPPPPPSPARLAGVLAAAVVGQPPAPPSILSAEGFAAFNAAFNGVG